MRGISCAAAATFRQLNCLCNQGLTADSRFSAYGEARRRQIEWFGGQSPGPGLLQDVAGSHYTFAQLWRLLK